MNNTFYLNNTCLYLIVINFLTGAQQACAAISDRINVPDYTGDFQRRFSDYTDTANRTDQNDYSECVYIHMYDDTDLSSSVLQIKGRA